MKSRKLWVGALALAVLAGAWWAQRSRESAPTRRWTTHGGLTAVDRATGQPIPDAVWTLIATRDGGFSEGIEQGVTPAAPPPELLAQARRMAVGAYGYEVRILEPDGLDALDGRVELEPAVDSGSLRIESDDDALASSEVRLMTSLQDPAAPASAVSLWWLHRTLTLTRAPLAVPIGRRHNVVAVAMGAPGTHVRWPFPARLAAGRTTIVHLERTRRIAFEMEPRRPSGHVHFGWLHVDPRRVGTLPEERRTGLAMHGYRGGYEAPALTAGVVFSNVPRVPLTGVVHSADGWFAVEVDAESTALPIALGAAPVRPLASMSIDGAPPPAGTVVLPGTVADDLVNAVLARGWLDDPLDPDGLGVRTPEPDAWRPARLPAADSLTAWHRDRGLARLRWTENGVAVGAWEPGSVHVSRHPANHARATLSVRSGCVGSSQVSSGSSRVDGMERPLRSTEISLLGGIPFGSVALELRTWRKGEAEPVVFRETVTLDAESPCARFSLVEDGTVRFDGTGTVPPTGR